RTPLLIQTSHTHLFGQTLIAGLLGLIFLFSSLREWAKALVLALPFVGTLVDIGGMWLTRFVWPGLSVLVIAGGSLFALGYALITVISLWQLWIGTVVRTSGIRGAGASPAEREAIKRQTGWTPDEDFYRFYLGRDGQGRLVAGTIFVTEFTIHGPVRVAVSLGPDGKVRGATVVELTEETYPWVKPLIDL